VKTAAAALLVLLAAACGGEKSQTPSQTATAASLADDTMPPPETEDDNIFSVARGLAVVSRTAENTLEHSAVHAVDGMTDTFWWSPPRAPSQTMVFSLGAPTRIEELGATLATPAIQVPASLKFETSMDGKSWSEALTYAPESGTALRPVTPREAKFVRVSVLEPKEEQAIIHSFRGRGRETASELRQFGGCWEVNGSASRLVQDGGRVYGVIGGRRPTLVEGGTDGRTARVMWQRGAMWGHAILTVTPDGATLTGLPFHEDPKGPNRGLAWFGSRCGDLTGDTENANPLSFLERAGRWALYGIAFDGNDRLLENESASTLDVLAWALGNDAGERHRLVAYEFRESDPAANKRRAEARIDALRTALRERRADLSRVEFIGAGSDRPGTSARFATERFLESRIDLERAH
jgi:hypothetical protein